MQQSGNRATSATTETTSIFTEPFRAVHGITASRRATWGSFQLKQLPESTEWEFSANPLAPIKRMELVGSEAISVNVPTPPSKLLNEEKRTCEIFMFVLSLT